MSESAHVLPNLPKVIARREAMPFEPVCAMFRRYLHEKKLKFTPERAMMLDAVLRKGKLFEADGMVDDLKGLGHRVSRATVYRTLDHLLDAGIVKQVFFDNKRSYYEVIVGRETHDYLICAASGRVIEINSEALNKLRDEICRQHGFQPLSHQFHIFGLSPDAQRAAAAEVPARRCVSAKRHEQGRGEHRDPHLAVPRRPGSDQDRPDLTNGQPERLGWVRRADRHREVLRRMRRADCNPDSIPRPICATVDRPALVENLYLTAFRWSFVHSHQCPTRFCSQAARPSETLWTEPDFSTHQSSKHTESRFHKLRISGSLLLISSLFLYGKPRAAMPKFVEVFADFRYLGAVLSEAMINTLPDSTMSQSVQATSPRDGAAYRQLVDAATREISAMQVLLLTTLPRGGLQVLQPVKVADTLVKPYVRQWQAEDDSSWKAIAAGKTVRAAASSAYVEQFLNPYGVSHVATAPVRDPVFDGYPGALQAHRSAEQGPFSEADLAKLTAAATRLGEQLAEARAARAGTESTTDRSGTGWAHLPPARLFALSAAGAVLFAKQSFNALDDRLRDLILAEVKQRVAKLNGEPWTSTRLLLPDSAGDHWTLNVVVHEKYPALSDGPVVFVCLQPTCPEWSTLRAGDFAADPEMSRLVPALRFMAAEFNRGPTLTEIAKQVHLSPFHFHRRFTELMGLTPKHFMLECQIHDAKGELVAGEKELAKIASDCGFAHQSHFTSRFKQATGLTPTRWRRMAHDRINGVE